MGHAWYAIKRRKDFIESVNSLIMDDFVDNGMKYQNKINVFINDVNYESLGIELLLKQNSVLSMKNIINNSENGAGASSELKKQSSKEKSKSKVALFEEFPILYDVCSVTQTSQQIKLFKTFYASMIHFAKLLQKWEKTKQNGGNDAKEAEIQPNPESESLFLKNYLKNPNAVFDDIFVKY